MFSFPFVQPINEYRGSCGCSGAKLSDLEYAIDSPSADEPSDVKYKFDFGVDKPKTSDPNVEL